MAQIHNIREYQFAFGLVWVDTDHGNVSGRKGLFGGKSKLSASGAQKKAIAIAKREKANLYISAVDDDICRAGYLRTDLIGQRTDPVHSFSLFASTQVPELNAVIFVEIGDTICLIVKDDGLPFSETLGRTPDFDDIVDSFESEHDTVDDYGIYVFSTNSSTDIVSKVKRRFNNCDYLDINFSEVKKFALSETRLSTKVTGKTKLIIALSVVLAATIGFVVLSELDEKDKIAEIERQKDALLKMDAELRPRYLENVKIILSSAKTDKADFLESVWLPISELPTTTDGFNLTKIECTGSSCKSSWKLINGYTSDFMLNEMKGQKSLATDNSQIDVTFPTKLQKRGIDLKELPSVFDFKVRARTLAEQAKQANCVFTITGQPSIIGIPKGKQPKDIPGDIAIMQGTFSIKGPLSLFNDYLDAQPNMSVSSIAFTFESVDRASFTVTGEFYVKN
jgi:hypothetical protein